MTLPQIFFKKKGLVALVSGAVLLPVTLAIGLSITISGLKNNLFYFNFFSTKKQGTYFYFKTIKTLDLSTCSYKNVKWQFKFVLLTVQFWMKGKHSRSAKVI